MYVISNGVITTSVQLLICLNDQLQITDTTLSVFFSTLALAVMISVCRVPFYVTVPEGA